MGRVGDEGWEMSVTARHVGQVVGVYGFTIFHVDAIAETPRAIDESRRRL